MYKDGLLNLVLKQSKSVKEGFIKSKGWETWYNDKYWVHIKTVNDHTSRDYTNYGMTLDEAVTFEIANRVPEKLKFSIDSVVNKGSPFSTYTSTKKLQKVLTAIEVQTVVDKFNQDYPDYGAFIKTQRDKIRFS